MDADLETIKNRFRDAASVIFTSLYDEFMRSTSNLDRTKDENVFRQLQGRYNKELEKRLNEKASAILGAFEGNKAQLSHHLAQRIKEMTAEFLVKARSM
ncbi:MAG TPA: hypothetical protein VHM26_11300 [Chitinophagaceae bacterium]|jgi:predicted transcriptional regulator|nr:hypothetical protein [Chitinophagaceae bacterium]